jgi:hypothetical protein
MRSNSAGLSVAWAFFALAGLCLGAADAQAQSGSVKAIFEKHNLIGTFAYDCSKPVSKDNLYFVNRIVDDGHVQRDAMSGPTTRDWSFMIDHAVELTSDEILTSGMRNGEQSEIVYRLENNQTRGVESTLGGKKLVTGAKFTGNGKDVPWVYKCDSAPPPSAAAGSVRTTFVKYNLLGIFAQDCTKPPKAIENWYYVDRLIDDNHVQRDVMESEASRTRVAVIDAAWEIGPNTIRLSGTLDGKPAVSIWRIDQGRMVQWEVIHDGATLISAGKWVKTGAGMPWLTRCGDVR